MSLDQAREKLKEFARYVSPSSAQTIIKAFDALEKFYESYSTRFELLSHIRFAVDYSVEEACIKRAISISHGISIVSNTAFAVGTVVDKVANEADINSFIQLLDFIMWHLNMEHEYIEWVRKQWESASKTVKMLFGI